MELYNQILEKSKAVDEEFEHLSLSKVDSKQITFIVPSFHPRSKQIKQYSVSWLSIEKLTQHPTYQLTKNRFFIFSETISKLPSIQHFVEKNQLNALVLKSIEGEVKTKPFLDKLLKENPTITQKDTTIVIVGGGLLLNIGAYLAERTSANLILFPSTVLSMADGAGGKVRVNFVSENRAYKHFYKSYYEPNAIFLDKQFLHSLPKKQIQIGLVEIIKHGLFQSPKLYDFLLSSGQKLFSNKNLLKKAILWSVSLKSICLGIDVEENENGSRRILRGGHDFSDRLEEDLKLQIPHGIAVAIGIISQLEMEKDAYLLEKAKKIFNKLEIPYTLEEYTRWKKTSQYKD